MFGRTGLFHKKENVHGEGKKRSGKRRLLLVLAAVLLLAAAGGIIHARTGSAVKVKKAEAVRTALKDTYTEEGRLTRGDIYSVVSEVSGAVEELGAGLNSEVHAGDLLYRISDSDYRYQKQQAESSIAGLEAQLDQSRIGRMMTSSPAEYLSSLEREAAAARAAFESAQTSYSAAQSLYGTGDIALVELEQISAQYKSAQAAYAQAQARYEESNRHLEELNAAGLGTEELNEQFYGSEERQLEAQLRQMRETADHLEEQMAKCEVRADRDGRVTQLPVRDMSVVQTGQVTVVLQGLGETAAEADVLASIAPYIHAGDPVEIQLHLRGRDEISSGVVTEVYDYADKGVSALGLDEYRVHVRVKLDEEEADAAAAGREGYGVDIVFTLFDEPDALVVPSGAVFRSGNTDYVFVIENGHAVRRRVSVLYSASSDTVLSEEDGEVREGDIVIDQADTKGIYEGAAVR